MEDKTPAPYADPKELRSAIQKRFVLALDRILKDNAGLRKMDFAKLLGVRMGSVSDILHGRQAAQLEMLTIIHKAYGISLRWLMAGDGPMYEDDSEDAYREEDVKLGVRSESMENKPLEELLRKIIDEKDEELRRLRYEYGRQTDILNKTYDVIKNLIAKK